jgi:hypothetical protein
MEELRVGISAGTIDSIPQVIRSFVLERIKIAGFSRRCPCLFAKLRRFDRAWFVLSRKDAGPRDMGRITALRKAMFGSTASFERDMLDPVIRELEEASAKTRQEPPS